LWPTKWGCEMPIPFEIKVGDEIVLSGDVDIKPSSDEELVEFLETLAEFVVSDTPPFLNN
jgi:hypothetical protein